MSVETDKISLTQIEPSTKELSHYQKYGRAHYLAHKDKYRETTKTTKSRIKDQIKRFINAYLSDNPCIDCGETDTQLLEFDHRPNEPKLFSIGEALSWVGGVDAVADEVLKCDVRCANCHRKMTVARKEGSYRTGHRPFATRRECYADNRQKARAALKEAKKPVEFPANATLVDLTQAATLCASSGLSHMNLKYWQNATDRGVVPCVVVGRRKLILKTAVTGPIKEVIASLGGDASNLD